MWKEIAVGAGRRPKPPRHNTVGVLFVSFLVRVLTGQVLQAHPDPDGRLRRFQLMPLSAVQDSQQSLAVMPWPDSRAYLDSRRTVLSAGERNCGR